MDYDKAKQLKKNYLFLIGENLSASIGWQIKHIVILPSEEGTLLAYTEFIGTLYPEWIAAGFDNEYIYKKSGIYILADGRKMPDKLTLYALLKNKSNNGSDEYKCELLYNLLVTGEVLLPNSQDFSELLQ
ncbi:MAG: hypothetical protein ACTHM5_17535 [Ginsengibacter sp.]